MRHCDSARLGERASRRRVDHAGPACHRPLVRSTQASGRRHDLEGALRALGGPCFALRHLVPPFAASRRNGDDDDRPDDGVPTDRFTVRRLFPLTWTVTSPVFRAHGSRDGRPRVGVLLLPAPVATAVDLLTIVVRIPALLAWPVHAAPCGRDHGGDLRAVAISRLPLRSEESRACATAVDGSHAIPDEQGWTVAYAGRHGEFSEARCGRSARVPAPGGVGRGRAGERADWGSVPVGVGRAVRSAWHHRRSPPGRLPNGPGGNGRMR